MVDEAALIGALEDGEIAGAGLDVFEQEPTPADNPLLKMDNVVVTPALCGYVVSVGHRRPCPNRAGGRAGAAAALMAHVAGEPRG